MVGGARELAIWIGRYAGIKVGRGRVSWMAIGKWIVGIDVGFLG